MGGSRQNPPGRHEQDLLREDPGILSERGLHHDPAQDRALEERRHDRSRQSLDDWWSSLGEDERLAYQHRRDELLLLLYEKYRYTRDDANREADRLLRGHPGEPRT